MKGIPHVRETDKQPSVADIQQLLAAAGDLSWEQTEAVGDDGTSMKSVNDPHMHQLTMTLSGKNKLTHEWVFFAGGKKQFVVRLDLRRKK